MKKSNLVLFFILLYSMGFAQTKTLWLDELDMKQIEAAWGQSRSNKSSEGNTLTVGSEKFTRGIGTHALSKFMLDLNKSAIRFTAKVGVDDEAKNGSVSFYLIADKKVIWESAEMKSGDKAKVIDIDLKGVSKLAFLVSDNGDMNFDHADWCEAKITYKGKKPSIVSEVKKIAQEAYILTPKPAAKPRINGAKIVGASPSKPFLYYIAATGERPMTFGARDLPQGLKLNANTGLISGSVAKDGEYIVKLTANNAKGEYSRDLRIVIGKSKLSLTPPMGWNSWNCWGLSVSDEKVKASADAMVSSGLINHGWTYINIDDGWEAPKRAKDGKILTNNKFPDMKGLCDYVHEKGMKIGIYSSPGELTCGGYLGSYGHEEQDAETYAAWGIDYLKYDWCSYGDKVDQSNPRLVEYKKPYIIMKHALDKQARDIVHSLCQYGMGEVWKWGAEMGQLWRTTGDITDTWNSMYSIGFAQHDNTEFAGPGSWNDPDMLVVGKVGWGPNLHASRLTPDEQYTHISLWSLLASPLLIGGDMSQMDEFTLNLLTNDEVIEINQDPLGKQAKRISKNKNYEIWTKALEDGSLAVGVFNTGTENIVDMFSWDNKAFDKNTKVSVSWSDLGITGKHVVRDLWRQKDLGTRAESMEFTIPHHGVMLVKLIATR